MFDTVFTYSSNGTPVYNEGGHPHFDNQIAIEAINHMIIPAVPADPKDRNQTRVCETYDFGRVIGVNHRVTWDIRNHNEITFYMDRGIDKPRGYQSHMIIKPCKQETKLTTVVVWFNNHWVLLTNFEGGEDPFPEPGTERYEKADLITKCKAINWFIRNPLSPNKDELEKAIKEKEEEINKMKASLDKAWLEREKTYMSTVEWNRRNNDIEIEKRLLQKMKDFREFAK